jgi:hypothetical protein
MIGDQGTGRRVAGGTWFEGPPAGAGEPAPDSPEAAARVLLLAIVGDGRLDADELAHLEGAGAAGRLGLSQAAFLRELARAWDDLTRAAHARAAGDDAGPDLAGGPARRWIDAVRDAGLRHAVLDLAFGLIRRDGRLDPGESRVFWSLMDRWGLTLDDFRAARWAASEAARRTASPTTVPKQRERRVHRLPNALVVA